MNERVLKYQSQTPGKHIEFQGSLLLPPLPKILHTVRSKRRENKPLPLPKETHLGLFEAPIKHVKNDFFRIRVHQVRVRSSSYLLHLGTGSEGRSVGELGAPEFLGEVVECAVVWEEGGGGGGGAELVAEAAELIGELGVGVRVGEG